MAVGFARAGPGREIGVWRAQSSFRPGIQEPSTPKGPQTGFGKRSGPVRLR